MTFSVTILGSGGAMPTLRRFPAAQALQLDNHCYLIDCAEGTQMQLRRYKIKVHQIKNIFISHLHGDHVFGLPGFLSSLSMSDHTEPVDLFGPPLLENWLSGQLKYFTPLGFPLNFHTLTAKEPELIYEDRRITVTCLPLKHRIPTWGYLFQEKQKPLNIRKEMIEFYCIPMREIPNIKAGADYRTEDGKLIANSQLTRPSAPPRSYAYCTDTLYFDALPPMICNVSLLYHEATYSNADRAKSTVTFHATAGEAARVALAANVKKLIIGHFSSRYQDVTTLVDEAKSIFPNTEAAEDGLVFQI